jgi:hypothetical protein
MEQEKNKLVNLCAAWQNANVNGKVEIQNTVFPLGLVYSQKTGFLNSKNEGLMGDLDQFFQQLGNFTGDVDTFTVVRSET